MNTNAHKTTGSIIASFALFAMALPNGAQAQFTDNNQTNIISGATNEWFGDYHVGSNYVSDALLILNGGVLSNGVGYIGFEVGADNNTAMVSGSGSVWRSRGNFHVGYSGASNSMVISNQGVAVNAYGEVGYHASNNSVLVTGAGSTWSNDNVYVGIYGMGNALFITNQGKVYNDYGFVGFYSNSMNNRVVVTGVGSVWSNRFLLHVGESGEGNSLVISNQGKVFDTEGVVGVVSDNNTVFVTGSGSVWSNLGNLFVGNAGANNRLVINNQGKVHNDFCTVGFYPSASSNSVLVTGFGSAWTTRDNVYIGGFGSGNSLVISNQGKVYDQYGYVGFYSNSVSNVVLVTGPGSIWNNAVTIIGSYGSGNSLVISNRGKLLDEHCEVGEWPGSSNNLALVTGPGSVWSNAYVIHVGAQGPGNGLIISNQGAVFTRIGSLGTTTPNASSNFVMVTGAGSTWSSVDDLSVGSDGSGNRLVVTNQGAVFSGRGTLGGASRSSNNTAFVTGFGSVWSISGDLCVGYSGSGSRLAIADRGKVVSFAASVGCNPDSSRNSVWVTGAGSVWSNHFLTVGSQGSGNSLVISNQGAVYDDYGFLGANGQSNGSNNCVRVVDNGLWRNKAELYIGRGVSNELIISGGSVIASNAFISFSDPVFGSGTNNCIRVESGSLFVRNSLGKGALVVSAGGGEGALVLNGGSVTVDQLFLTNGNNSVIAFNGGTLHSKGTTVTNNQQFVVGNSTSLATFHLLGGAHSFNDGLRIRTNSFLTGCGTIHGDVVVDAGGTVRADCGGTLTFTGNVTNNGVMMASNRTVLESSGPLVNNGKILLLNGGTINFYDAFINNGVILNADLGLALERDGNGGFFIRYTGAPDVTYRLQRAARVTGTWSDLATNTAPASGLIEYHETSPPPGKAFYRTVQP